MKQKIRNLFGNPRVQPFIIGLFFVLLAILLIIGADSVNRTPQNAPEFTPPDGPAILMNGEELYSRINDAYQFDALRNDLALFGRSAFEVYKSGEAKEVIFEITTDINLIGNNINFYGKYHESDDNIQVNATLLKNSRINLSIKNTVTGHDINDDLASNSQRNKFISTLPIIEDTHVIEFHTSSDSFVIKLYDVEADNSAKQQIMSGLGVNDVSNEKIDIVPLHDFSDRAPRINANMDEGGYEITPDDY